LRPHWLLERAISILAGKAERLVAEKAIVCDTDSHGMITIKITNEDYTLLNYMQSTLYKNEVIAPDGVLSYVGYYKSHPLEEVMFLKLKFRGSPPASILDWLGSRMRSMGERLRNYRIL
jgi:DNA-directed RNA polymerase subunit L